MDNKRERVCLVCGQNHNGNICPIIERKQEKNRKSRKKNFLIGNILLECIRQGIDFCQILLEIAEQNEEAYDELHIPIVVFPIEGSIEYFAVSLNCRSKEFFKEPEKTIDEYSKYLSNYSFMDCSVGRDDTGKLGNIEIELEIDDYKYVETLQNDGVFEGKYSFSLAKELSIYNKWKYNLYLNLPKSIIVNYPEDNIQNRKTYFWESKNCISSYSFLLASDSDGKLCEMFENILDEIWDHDKLVEECTFTDSRFDIWINKLQKATVNHLLEWKKYGSPIRYYSKYENTDVQVEINIDATRGDRELLYIRNQSGGLGIRFGQINPIEAMTLLHYLKNRNEENELVENVKSNSKLVELINFIEEDIVNKKKNNYLQGLKSKKIDSTDVVIVTQSMICRNQQHQIIPLRGIVELLTQKNEQIEYEIYVGYCKECKRYYVFKSQFNEMLKHGNPLCAVYYSDMRKEKKEYPSFKYKSQSVLNAMGYSVGMNDELSADERQKILVTALQKNLFDVHDLLSFLTWLIRTRETQNRYKEAIRKWTEDMKFVENYEKHNRESISINSITVV